jgi:hypothetical protein
VLLQLPQLEYFSCYDQSEDQSKSLCSMHSALPHLQQLQTLHLSWYGEGVAAEDFASLTASSHLTKLVLVNCDVPAGAARHMFGAGWLLPHLQQLNISYEGFFPTAPADRWKWLMGGWMLHNSSLLFEADYAQHIVDSCPALQSLGTLRVAAGLPHAQLLPLVRLSALTGLSVGGAGCTDAVAELVLAKLTGVHSSIGANSCMLVAAKHAVHDCK